jgi:hypothetical protein
MGCVFGLGVAILLWHMPLVAREPTPAPDATRRASMLHLTPFTRGTVRNAIDLAKTRIARDECRLVYGDFELPDGSTPRSKLDVLGIRPEDFVESLVFVDGWADRLCASGLSALTTTPGSRVIHVCPSFVQAYVRDSRRSAVFIIHESLHALGLGENPPSSNEISQRVERRCW